jgi:hypothetical protein
MYNTAANAVMVAQEGSAAVAHKLGAHCEGAVTRLFSRDGRLGSDAQRSGC